MRIQPEIYWENWVVGFLFWKDRTGLYLGPLVIWFIWRTHRPSKA